MMTWLYAKLAGMGGKLIGLLSLLLTAFGYLKYTKYKGKKEGIMEQNMEALKAQQKQREEIDEAIKKAQKDSKAEVEKVNEQINNDDYSSLND